MTGHLHAVTTVDDLARQLLHLRAREADLKLEIARVTAAIVDAVEVGGRVDLDGETVFRVSQRAPFDLDRAVQVLPADVVAACTETVTEQRVDRKRLEALATGLGLREQCLKPGTPFVTAAR